MAQGEEALPQGPGGAKTTALGIRSVPEREEGRREEGAARHLVYRDQGSSSFMTCQFVAQGLIFARWKFK